jgi:L-2-hydroxyglutarate oxidase LhgO
VHRPLTRQGVDTDVLVVGAGAVGLACAAVLARRGREVLVVERHAHMAQETSSRNSQVIHAGLYYPPGSAKARLCVEGRERLYARCRAEGIPHRVLGKLVVATRPEEVATLETLRARGTANGAPGLAIIDASEVSRREPAVHALAALLSPCSGVVDAHALCLSYAAEAEAHGARLAMRTEVLAVEAASGHLRVEARAADGQTSHVRCGAVVNAAGLCADRLAECAGLAVDALGYRQHPCKGDYFALAPGAPLRVAGLVYPVPAAAGLGLHATIDLGGRIRFGPDATYVERVHYDVDPAKAGPFAEAASRYLPALRAEWLSPDGAGVRPKLQGPNDTFRDFLIVEESARGLPGFVNLLGIESPGLTAAEAIALEVAAQLAAS